MVRLRDQKRRHCFAGRIGFRASIGHKPVSREDIGEPKQLDVSHTWCECFLHTSLPQLHRLSRTGPCAAVAIEDVASLDTTIEPLAAQL
jgi:hypothetical protein